MRGRREGRKKGQRAASNSRPTALFHQSTFLSWLSVYFQATHLSPISSPHRPAPPTSLPLQQRRAHLPVPPLHLLQQRLGRLHLHAA